MRARQIWLKVHLYLALVAGAFIAILGITGSLLVFHPQIDGLVSLPAAYEPPATGGISAAPAMELDALVSSVERQTGLPVGLIRIPQRDGVPMRVELFDAARNEFRMADVDTRDGTVLTNRLWGGTFVTVLFDIHTKLMLGEPGLDVVGVLGLLLIVSVVTGLYLWWPFRGGWWRALTYRGGRGWLPLNFEVHRLAGLYFAVVLFVVALAGVYITLPEQFLAVTRMFTDVTGEVEGVPSAPAAPGTPRIELRRVVEAFHEGAPGGRIRSIVLPDDSQDTFGVMFVDRGEPDNFYGQSTLWIDQYTGDVLASHAYSQMGAGDRFLAMQLPLHDGQFLGLPGQLIVFLSGLVTCLLYGTGLYLWWKRRRPASAKARRPPSPRA
jgi:uncharacterized iron-regulated membrane protein